MRKVLKTIGIVVMLLLAAIPMISSAAAEQNVCRDLPSGTQTPGSAIIVSLDTTIDSATFYAIDEEVPSGWMVTGASDAGDYTSDPGHVKWVVTSGAVDKTYTYTVQIPGAAADGTYAFGPGEFLMEGMGSASPIDCDTDVTVEAGAVDLGEPNVCRDLPSGTQTPGSAIIVSLDTTIDSATFYAIDEEVPSGWMVTGASDAGDYTSDPGHVKWVVTSGAVDKTYTYTVQIPGAAADGTYAFGPGEFLMEGMGSASPIDCDTDVTVEAGAVDLGEPNVCRDLPSGTQTPGSAIIVSLDTTIDSATFYAIDEEVPSGWMVTGASDAGDYTSDPGHVKWVVTSGAVDKTYTYTVQIPGAAADGTYAFSGKFQMEGMGSPDPIDCDTEVTVGFVASAVRTLPASVERGEQFTVSMDLSDYGTTGSVVETIPESFTYVNSTLDASNVTVVNDTVTFTLWGETNFEYDVTASNTEGTYAFSGILTDESANEVVVGGDTSIDVVLPDGIILLSGWNFISVPYEMDNSSVDNILAGVNYSALTYYNASNSLWENPVTTFDPLKGYWIKIPTGLDTQVMLMEVLVPKVPATPATLQLYEGWNSIGYTDSMDILSAELTLGSIDDYYTSIWGPWIPDTMSYEYVGHNGQTGVIENRHVGTDIFEMSPYNGYWVFVTQNCVLNSIGS